MRPRVLIVTRNFPPLVGGMERLLWNAREQLAQDFDCSLVGPAGCERHAAGAVGCATRPLPRFLLAAAARSLLRARRERPDLVLAGSGLTAPIALAAARIAGAVAAGFVHGLDLVVRNRAYQALFGPAIRRLDLVFANSANTARLARERGVPAGRIQVIPPGVEWPPREAGGASLRERFGLGDRPLLLFVGRRVPRKGLAEFLERSLPAILREAPETVLLVVGGGPTDALARPGAGGASVEELLEREDLRERVQLTGPVDDATLARAYSEADALVFPLREVPGDVEGFGMVAVEAASHGLPTVAFSVGGVPDAVAPGRSGLLVEPDDHDAFARAVLELLSGRSPVTAEACREHARGFAWSRFGERLREFCRAAVEAAPAPGAAKR